MRSYKDALRAKGVKALPSLDKLRTSKADAKPGDKVQTPTGFVEVRSSDLTDTPQSPKLHIVEAA